MFVRSREARFCSKVIINTKQRCASPEPPVQRTIDHSWQSTNKGLLPATFSLFVAQACATRTDECIQRLTERKFGCRDLALESSFKSNPTFVDDQGALGVFTSAPPGALDILLRFP